MKDRLMAFWQFCKKFTLFCIAFSFLTVLVFRWLPVSFTPLMIIRVMDDKGEKNSIDHDWVSYSSMPNNLQLAVTCCEDQRFLTHHGFDFESIQVAMDEAEDGGRSRGASTISQQTAKNVFLWPGSNYVRKGMEAWYTLLIELCWSKQRIMEVYLNSVEFGDGIYGCAAASEHFFHKKPMQLSNLEAARLAVVLPNPLKYQANASKGYVMRRVNWALEQMHNYGNQLNYNTSASTK